MIEEIIKYINKLIKEENKRLINESNNDRIRARKHAIAIMKNILLFIKESGDSNE